MTSSFELRLFAIQLKNDRKVLFCFICQKRNCHHISEEYSDINSDEIINCYHFDMENDFESEQIEELSDLISSVKYPCKLFVLFYS